MNLHTFGVIYQNCYNSYLYDDLKGATAALTLQYEKEPKLFRQPGPICNKYIYKNLYRRNLLADMGL
ncbi:hypothetical protein HYN43_029210 [Mucilaginibacter celer]|uniref:NodB homology domain-containing protein n=1 Tax=Mucilaginibacter celer TaxID=2305508 RepID=A0A494VYA5_9SPHI|nr:hypothetical protein HYN43_029210 [Mucilaginibacter celer]